MGEEGRWEGGGWKGVKREGVREREGGRRWKGGKGGTCCNTQGSPSL